MILVDEHKRFISADHIQDIYIKQLPDTQQYTVIVQLSGTSAVFGRRGWDAMTRQMALELRKRLVKAIVDYKSSDKPEIQLVEIPKYEEVHPKEDSNSS